MKQGRSLQELAAEIERQSKAKRDFVSPMTDLHMGLRPDDDDPGSLQPTMLVGTKGEFPIRPLAHSQIATRLKIPSRYYDRMREDSPELLARNVNHWLEDTRDRGDSPRRMVRTMDGHMRAFLSSKYRCLDNDLIASAALPVFADMKVTIASCEITEKRLYIKVTVPSLQMEVKLGDIVEAGLTLSTSEVGWGAVSVKPMVNRLVCMNGMVINDLAFRKYHIGRAVGNGDEDKAYEFFQTDTIEADNIAFGKKLRDVVAGALSKDVFERVVARLEGTTEKRINQHPEKAVELTAKLFSLSEGEQGGVLRHLIDGGDLTQWGLCNAVTRHSQDVDSYDRATELERMGGQIVELNQSQWTHIAEEAA